MAWADDIRRMNVRTNAETPEDAQNAIKFGAEGIGLCRTEHMFFDPERIQKVREMIFADNKSGRDAALEHLLPAQRSDFKKLFEIMDGLPVTIRLLDPPLHEFLPHEALDVANFASVAGLDEKIVNRRLAELSESNPMLGHRGCRLGLTYPEIYAMQARAILEAAVETKATPEIMVPLIVSQKELQILKAVIDETAIAVFEEKGKSVEYLVGTMIEIPRAALMAGDIAETAEFFSFGTNDLTQTALGMSRDDASSFLPDYVDKGVFEIDPFVSIDQGGVGQLLSIAAERGRMTRPDLKLGICGEHGGDPASIAFCEQIGLSYVSCSPFRVPIARLAAAQATILHKAHHNIKNIKDVA
jgi:pyruvate,orthophosphate dikinase